MGAAPPPGGTEQVLYETERAVGVTAGKIVQIVSLWPGRDEYIDHTAAFLAGEPVEPFAARLRQPTPHQLVLSHPVLLALSGKVRLSVEFELQHGATSGLDLVWEYWDGATWRGFIATSTECSWAAAADFDSTDGLVQSGSFVLETDCASAAKTKVNGIDGYWLRARLTQPLPPDPGQSLPEVDTIRLSSTVNGALRGRIAVGKAVAAPVEAARAELLLAYNAASPTPTPSSSLGGVVSNAAGRPVEGAVVRLTDPADPTRAAYTSAPTGADGIYQIPNVNFSRTYLFDATFAGITFSAPDELRRPPQAASSARPQVDLRLSVEGLAADKAFADATALDLSKPFYPLGQQPQPGSAFYFANEEAFGKPLAKVRIYIARTLSPQDEGAVSGSSALAHQVDWEYWNSRMWAPLAVTSNFADSKLDLDRTEVVDFTVPIDMAPVKVNEQEARWVRVRLQSGSYGFKQTISFNTDAAGVGTTNTFTYVAAQPPVLASFAIGYTWQYGPFHAERVLAYNDFAYVDRTAEAMWPGTTFAPFERVRDLTPALYLGFDKQPPSDQLGLFFDVVEAPDAPQGPALVWEYWDGLEWTRTPAEDETGYLRRPGIVNVLAQSDDTEFARFDAPHHWLRARLKEDGPPGEPVLTSLHPNAVWASERHTLHDLPLGTSNGTPNQRFALTQTPVLDGERIEVRELGGARANVEWRILAMALWSGDGGVLAQFEQLLARESTDTEVAIGPLRLVRNRQKQVTEAWVRWERREQLYFSAPGDRHYALDASSGRVDFGDGENGRVPPAGAAILVREVSVGGGSKGNVAAGAIKQLLGVVPGIQDVFNPRAAEGGADGEPASAVLDRGPRTVRHRGRAMAPGDYETLAVQASPAVKMVHAIPGRSPSGQMLAGWVTVLIVPGSLDAQPYPSFGLREQVRKYIEARAPADLAALHRIHVTGPTYLPVGVAASITPVDPSRAGAVEQSVRDALERFLHPVLGGRTERGGPWVAMSTCPMSPPNSNVCRASTTSSRSTS
ncbi:baseplate J/gp47 family protein [Variovorax ureilyticus]|uniref:baseplate J/gp47 family protein n=1 Tax=Variovorax ureilyticus TaxID=1836198 RepID=UPI003D66D82C